MNDQQNNEQRPFSNSPEPVQGEERSRTRGAEETPEDNDGIYLTGDSKLQSQDEFEKDKHGSKPADKVTASGTDDHQTNSGGVAGTDRAGTAERKDYGDPKLNQGIEEQGGQKTYED